MKAEEKFMSLAPMISTTDEKAAYLRIGRGLAFGKVWCDYVRADNGERVYLQDKFYPTIREAINALYEVVTKTKRYMKKTNVNVEYKKTLGSAYAVYSTKDHKKIAELDYPTKGRSEFRVYKGDGYGTFNMNYITYPTLPMAMQGAEQICKAFLLDKDRYVEKFNYPQEIIESFKMSD